jgi:site-specific recombinase XerD
VNLRPGTLKNYRRAINHLNNFLSARNAKQLLLEEFKYEHASDFKNYLISSNPQLNRTGMTEVSAAGVIKKFRTIFGQAVDRELISKNPFKLVKIKTKSPVKERLTIGQVRQLYEVDDDKTWDNYDEFLDYGPKKTSYSRYQHTKFTNTFRR